MVQTRIPPLIEIQQEEHNKAPTLQPLPTMAPVLHPEDIEEVEVDSEPVVTQEENGLPIQALGFHPPIFQPAGTPQPSSMEQIRGDKK